MMNFRLPLRPPSPLQWPVQVPVLGLGARLDEAMLQEQQQELSDMLNAPCTLKWTAEPQLHHPTQVFTGTYTPLSTSTRTQTQAELAKAPEAPAPSQSHEPKPKPVTIRKRVDRPIKSKKKPRFASRVIVGPNQGVMPIIRRTRYVKLLEAMTAELEAVKQQLYVAQKRLQSLGRTSHSDTDVPDESDEHEPTPLHNTSSNDNNADTSFDSLLPQTRDVLLLSQAQESLHDATYVHSPILIWKMDLRQRVLDANIAFCEANGWSVSELLGCMIPPGNCVKPMFPPHAKFQATDVAPLKSGLPVGLIAQDLLPAPHMYQCMAQLFSGQAQVVTCTRRHINAKGELCESRVTSWLVYDDGTSHPSVDAQFVSLPPSTSRPGPIPSSSSPFVFLSIPSSSPSSWSSVPARGACESLLASFYSTLGVSDPSLNPFFQRLVQWVTPPIAQILASDEEIIGERVAATFGQKRTPLYIMSMTIPSDVVVLRQPESSHLPSPSDV